MELVGTSKLADLLIHVTNEEAIIDADIPTHKTETGIDLTDHVERKPIVVRLTGILIRPTEDRQESLIKKLEAIENKGRLVVYEGRRIYKNMLMSNLNIKAHSKIMNGYEFTLTLTEVRIGKSSYVQPKTKATTSAVESAGRKQTANAKESPLYHIVKRGDTYWALSKKYGVTIDSLRKLNRYPDRKIPIGVKLRIR